MSFTVTDWLRAVDSLFFAAPVAGSMVSIAVGRLGDDTVS